MMIDIVSCWVFFPVLAYCLCTFILLYIGSTSVFFIVTIYFIILCINLFLVEFRSCLICMYLFGFLFDLTWLRNLFYILLFSWSSDYSLELTSMHHFTWYIPDIQCFIFNEIFIFNWFFIRIILQLITIFGFVMLFIYPIVLLVFKLLTIDNYLYEKLTIIIRIWYLKYHLSLFVYFWFVAFLNLYY